MSYTKTLAVPADLLAAWPHSGANVSVHEWPMEDWPPEGTPIIWRRFNARGRSAVGVFPTVPAWPVAWYDDTIILAGDKRAGYESQMLTAVPNRGTLSWGAMSAETMRSVTKPVTADEPDVATLEWLLRELGMKLAPAAAIDRGWHAVRKAALAAAWPDTPWLPFPWRPAQFLAGAYPGARRGHLFALDNGVTHIRPRVPIQLDKMRRERDHLLCRGEVDDERLVDDGGLAASEPVTCPKCLEIAGRIQALYSA